MLATIAAAVLAQATPAPAAPLPMPSMSAVWVPTALEKGDFARYVRKEDDGTESTISGSQQVCECDPNVEMKTLTTIFAQVPGAVIQRATVTVCGQPAQRMTVTGYATPASAAKNVEVLAFREAPALVQLVYAFKSSAPLPEDEAALLTLCPPHPAPTSKA